MNEEEKQELETLRAEKLRREQVERARAALERGGVPQSFAPLLAGGDDGDTDRRKTPRYAVSFLRDITDVKQGAQERDRILQKNVDMQRLISGLVKQVERFGTVDMKTGHYEFGGNTNANRYTTSGPYSQLVDEICARYRSVDDLKPLKSC